MRSSAIGFTVALVLIGTACREPGEVHDQIAPPTGPATQAPAPKPAPQPAVTAPEQKPQPPAPGSVNEVGAATKAFLDRMQEYVTFHNNVEKMVPPLKETSDPAKIAAREKALGDALIKQRPDAKQGDFFIKAYEPILRQLIREDFLKRAPADRKALVVELPKGVKFGVNTHYPTTLPLATFPANLLKALPELPPELEYRIVGRDLILRDTTGNVVVDVLPNIFPIPS
jgi:hypothetical protein